MSVLAKDENVEDTVKIGAEISRLNKTKIQSIHDACCDLGATCREDPNATEEPNTHPEAAKPGMEVVSRSIELYKGISLDQQVEAVRSAVYRLYEQLPYNPTGDRVFPYCECVQSDFVVIKLGNTYYQASYTMSDNGAVIQPRSEWEQVEITWTPVGDSSKATDTENAMKTLTLSRFNLPTVSDAQTVKALGETRLGNYIVLWGDENKRDLTKEWFTPDTEELETIFKSIGKLPALYHHAMDGAAKTSVIGVVDTMIRDDLGIWIETQLDMSNQYAGAVQQLARQNVLGASSGTLPGARKVSPEGEIKRWPIVECSFTPTPAEPRMRTEWPVTEMKAIYKNLGLSFPEQENPAGDEKSREIQIEMEMLKFIELESLLSGA